MKRRKKLVDALEFARTQDKLRDALRHITELDLEAFYAEIRRLQEGKPIDGIDELIKMVEAGRAARDVME